MVFSSRSVPGLRGWLAGVVAVGLMLALSGLVTGRAHGSATDASSAAGFIESAQNSDGGFPVNKGQASDPLASLWATVALLAAGKNPQSEQVNNGQTADDYLAAHLSSYQSSPEDLGLLAIVQAASGASASRYGNPEQALKTDLRQEAILQQPAGAAMGAIGLLGLNANQEADKVANTLVNDQQTDGGWGAPGNPTSASTALVLEALAETGVRTYGTTAVTNGLKYLKRAQGGDGSISTSVAAGTDFGGDVTATAFTIQALNALHHPNALKTASGQTIEYGLASYQQPTTGGLTTVGGEDPDDAASVIQTAQAYPAFDGVAFPLPYVAPVTTAPKNTTPSGGNHASSGTATNGISDNTAANNGPVAAYKGGSAAGSAKSKAGRGGSGTGQRVSGRVVGAASAPKLTTRSGRAPVKDLSGLFLALGLLAVAGAGAVVDRRRPGSASRSAAARAVQATSDSFAAARRRGAFAPATVVLVGVALIVTPSVTGMWSRAPHGANLIKAFQPYVRAPELARLQTDVSAMDAGFTQAARKGPSLEYPGVPDARKRFATANPSVVSFAKQWRSIDKRFQGLLNTIGANRSNFDAVASLPSFDAFPWFLVAPGALLALLAIAALILPRGWRRLRLMTVGLGACLVLAPLAFGLFSAGPKGSRIVSAFGGIETSANVTALQDDFASLVTGQANLETQLPTRVQKAIPAVGTLNRRWPTVLGDFTPVLGVMSDNVGNYRAVAALPDFSAFPWLFAIPGLLVIAIAALDGFGIPSLIRRRARGAEETQLQARSTA